MTQPLLGYPLPLNSLIQKQVNRSTQRAFLQKCDPKKIRLLGRNSEEDQVMIELSRKLTKRPSYRKEYYGN